MKIWEEAGEGLLSSRIASRLLWEMEKGEYAQAEQLPTETELAECLGVSRTVIRDALSHLEREGLIERCRGIGTRIHRDVVEMKNRLDLKTEYFDMLESMGYTPDSDCISLSIIQADPVLAGQLRIEVGAPVILRKKRVLASGEPVIYSIDYVSQELIGTKNYMELDWSKSIFAIFQDHCGLTVQSSITQIKAVTGERRIRNLLQLTPDQALLELRELSFAKMGRPIFSTQAYYTDFFTFSLLRKKL